MAPFECQENNRRDRPIDKVTDQQGKSISGCLMRPGERATLQNRKKCQPPRKPPHQTVKQTPCDAGSEVGRFTLK